MSTESMVYAFPVLVADIGGTNARFAVIPAADAEMIVCGSVETANFEGPIDAVKSLGLADRGLAPKSAFMAMAGPVVGDEIKLTNCHWRIAPRRMIAELDLETVVVLNDFEALALALPALRAEDLQQIGGGTKRDNAPMVVIGPGTGLGVAGMVHAGGRWVPVPGEGGHVSLGPETREEVRIWPHIEGFGQHIEAEHLVCGRGLLRLAMAVAAANGVPCPYAKPADVTQGMERGETLALAAVELFAGLLGRLAGDMAVTFLARGGIFIGGGVSLRVAKILASGSFRRAFENKAPHDKLVAAMPTWLIRHDLPALLGLAAYARAPQAYAVDLAGRLWQR